MNWPLRDFHAMRRPHSSGSENPKIRLRMRHVQGRLMTKTCSEFKAQKSQQSTRDTSKAGRRSAPRIEVKFMPPLVAKINCNKNARTEAGAASHGGTSSQDKHPISTQQSNEIQ